MIYSKKWTLILALFASLSGIHAQQSDHIPAVYTRLHFDEEGRLYLQMGEKTYYAATSPPQYTLKQLYGKPVGTENGHIFDFGKLKGKLTYGLIPYGKAAHPLPAYQQIIK